MHCRLRRAALVLLLVMSPTRSASAEPVTTIITHGFQLDSCAARQRDITLTWMRDMADAIIARSGGAGAVCRYDSGSGAWLLMSGTVAPAEPIVLLFDWIQESDGDILGSCPPPGTNWGYAQAAGDALHAALRDPRGDLPAGFDFFAGRAVHFIGHSRGTIVNSYTLARLAGDAVAVDQVTTLDPHPVNGTLDACVIPSSTNWGDDTPVKWANVAWADNYWRADGSDAFPACDFDGIALDLDHVQNMNLNAIFGEPSSPGGGGDPNVIGTCDAEHSKVHAWYLGTIPLSPPVTYPNECPISYGAWYSPGAQGYDFSFLGALTGGALHGSTTGVPAPDLPIIYNGEFDNGADAATLAGWRYHGGAGSATMPNLAGDDPYLQLGPAAGVSVTHNRFFAPNCGGGSLTLQVRREGAGGENDRLRVLISFADGSGAVDAAGPIEIIALSAQFTEMSGRVPASFAGRACLLTILIDDSAGGAVASTVGIDDVSMSCSAPCAGDLDDSAAVNGLDLAMQLAAWTGAAAYAPCPPLQPADLDGDCRVNGLDLAMLLAAWGPCP